MAVVTTHRTVIDDIAYETETFPADQSLDLLARLFAVAPREEIGLLLAVVFKLRGSEEDVAKAAEIARKALDPELVAHALCNLAERAVTGEKLSALAKALLARTTSDSVIVAQGLPPVAGTIKEGQLVKSFGTHFQGRLRHLFQVLAWVIQVGFEVL
jgi:hypothetical protein